MTWLSGFTYRKSHVINAATGAGTNYQKRIKVFYDDIAEDPLIGKNIEKYASNPLTFDGDSDGYGAVHPSILYFPDGEDGYKFWLFYEKGVSEFDCDVYLMRSNDGLSWVSTGVTNPIITTAGGFTHCPDPDVIKVGDTWYMYLVGGGSGTTSIYRFTSSDGKTWTQNPSGATYVLTRGGAGTWDENDVVSPVILYEDGIWYLFYVGEDSDVYKLGLATSDDGVNFNKSGSNPIHAATGEIWHIGITKYNGKYWLYWTGAYVSSDSIKLATSTDKITWTDYTNNPVITRSGVGWELTRLYTTRVVKDGTTGGDAAIINLQQWIYYSAFGGTYYKIGLARTPPDTYVGEDVSLEGHCRTDFGDVRFTDNDEETLLDCWMEEKVDSDYAIFWVEVADDLSTNPVTIYVYYGKANATYPYLASDLAQGEATFVLFDNFEDDNYDTNKWSTQSANVTESGGKLRVDPTTTYGGVRSLNSISLATGKCIEAKVAWENVNDQMGSIGFCNVIDNSTWYSGVSPYTARTMFVRAYNYAYDRWEFWNCYSANSPYHENFLSVNGLEDTDYHKISVESKEGSKPTFCHDEFGPWAGVQNIVSTTWYVWLSKAYSVADGYMDIDYVAVRNLVNPEPLHDTWGTEEITEIYNAVVTITEIIGCYDTKTRTKSIFRTIVELLGGLDVKSRTKSIFRTITESLGNFDTRSKVKTVHRTITEILGILDIKNRMKSCYRTITELLGLTDIKSIIHGKFKTVIELLGLTDSKSKIHGKFLTIIETLGFKDTKSRVKSIHRTITEKLGLKDIKNLIRTGILKKIYREKKLYYCQRCETNAPLGPKFYAVPNVFYPDILEVKCATCWDRPIVGIIKRRRKE